MKNGQVEASHTVWGSVFLFLSFVVHKIIVYPRVDGDLESIKCSVLLSSGAWSHQNLL